MAHMTAGHGIKWGMEKHSTLKSRLHRRTQREKNRQMRADLYSRMDGEAANRYAAEWHSTLDALSKGTAG